MARHIRAQFLIPAIAGLALVGCAKKAPPGAPPPPTPFVEAILYDGTGKNSGKITLMPNGDTFAGVITVTRGLKPGPHGMHIHAVGQCTLPDFTSAGPHLNPDGKQHGTENPAGPHQGDLPILVADGAGAASMTFTVHTTFNALMDPDGSAFVVHADADDMKTDPSGNSGSRVLCGVLYRKNG